MGCYSWIDKGDYEAREENMRRYLQKIKDLILIFTSFKVQRVSRLENLRANFLSKLATSASRDLPQESFFEVIKESNIEEPTQNLQIGSQPS